MLKLAGLPKMINKNTCSKAERQGARKNEMTNLASLLRATANASMEKSHKHVHFSRQTLSLFMQTDDFQIWNPGFHWIQSCQEFYLSDTFIFFIVLSSTVCLFWHSSKPLLPCPSELFEGNEKQQSFLRFRLKGTSCRGSLVHHPLFSMCLYHAAVFCIALWIAPAKLIICPWMWSNVSRKNGWWCYRTHNSSKGCQHQFTQKWPNTYINK